MNNAILTNRLESTLRAVLRPGVENISTKTLALVVIAGSCTQGAVMGTFTALGGGSAWFVAFSALKVPLFLGLTAVLCFPAMRVLYFLLGLGEAFPTVARALLAGQAAFAAILASLSPFTLVFYLSGASYRGALLWNITLFALAGVFAQKPVRDQLAPLLRGDARHLKLWKVGFGLWAFVAVQLAWNLRPFLGAPDAPVQFLRANAFTNAYLAIWQLIFG